MRFAKVARRSKTRGVVLRHNGAELRIIRHLMHAKAVHMTQTSTLEPQQNLILTELRR
jgi:hypothetical protein